MCSFMWPFNDSLLIYTIQTSMECLIYTSILFMFKSGYNAIKEGVLFTLSPTGPGSPASPGNPGIPVGPWEEDSYS